MAIMKTNKLSILSGLVTGLVLIAYFLLMKLLGLNRVLELRFLNLVFLFIGVWFTLSRANKKYGDLYYLHGLGLGLQTSFIAVSLFSAFIGFYLQAVDPGFMEYLRVQANLGKYINPWILAHVIFGESFSAGAIMTFILMQYYKAEPEKAGKL
ncbi:MAG: DUF4199 domain-containing protein [Bacteroidia bacterium]